MFTSLIFIGTACIVNMTITINGPKPATDTREGWNRIENSSSQPQCILSLFQNTNMFVSTLTLFKYLFFRLHFFHWEKVQLFYVDKVIPIVNICSGVSDMYEGNGKIFFILFSREKGSLHLFGTFQGNSIKCIFGKLSARTDVCKNKVLFGSSFGKRWGFQRGLGSLSIDCAFNTLQACC